MNVATPTRVLIVSVCCVLGSTARAGSVRVPLVPTDPRAGMSFRSDLAIDFVWTEHDRSIEVSICNLGSESLYLESFAISGDVLVEPVLKNRNGAVWLSGERAQSPSDGPPELPFTMSGLPGPADRSQILTVRYSLPDGVGASEFAETFLSSVGATAGLDVDAEVARVTAQGLQEGAHFSTLVVVPLPKSAMAGALCLGGIAFGNVARRRAQQIQ